MTGMERIRAALAFAAPDRPPVIAQVFGHAATLAGVALPEYLKTGEVLARCQLAAWSRYGYDAVFALMDTNVESEALGSTLTFREANYPFIERYALSGTEDPERLQVPDPESCGRMPQMLHAARSLRREVGDQVPIIGCVLGPVTLVVQLMGAEKALYLAVDDPPRFEALLDFAEKVAISFGVAQVKAGAHFPMLFDPCASPAVIPHQLFREIELPRLTRIFAALKKEGALASFLHISGPTDDIYPYYPQTGLDLANLDYCNDPVTAQKLLPGTCIDGNLKPVAFVEGTPAEIAAESARLIDLFRERGGFILSSGCEIPPEARPENVAALVHAAAGS